MILRFHRVLASSTDIVVCLHEKWRELLSVILFAILAAILMALVRKGVRKYLEPRMKRVSFGGLFLATSLFLFAVYLMTVLVLHVVSHQSFEAFFFTTLGMGKIAPAVLGCLGSDAASLWAAATPLYFPLLYGSLHVVFVILAFLMLWGLVGFREAFSGVKKNTKKKDTKKEDTKKKDEQDNSLLRQPASSDSAPSDSKVESTSGGGRVDRAPMPMGPLAPMLGPIFQTFGYWLDLRHVEHRYKEYVGALSFTLTLFKWLCLPAAFLGTLPPSLWILAALVINNFKENLKAPTALETEKKEKKEKAAAEKEEQKAVSIRQVIQAIEKSDVGFEIHPTDAHEAIPSQLADSKLLTEGPAMALISQKLGLTGALYAHQETCAAHLRGGENVLLATAPLSGRTTIGDLLALDSVLTKGQSVLYLCPDASEAAQRRAAFKEVAYIADWDWNLFVHDLANEPPEHLDLQMRQPSVLFTTTDELHEHLLPNARDWDFFLQSLGLVVSLSLESYTGALGANLYRLTRRFAKICERYGSQPLFFATAVPYSVDIRAFAEKLLGVPLVYVGPGTDTSPEPSREILTCRPLPQGDTVTAASDDVPIPVMVTGQVVGLGHRAELFGFENSLTREEMGRVDEVLLKHGRARFRGGKQGVTSGAGAHAPGRKAEVVVAQANTDDIRLMPELTRHFGADLVDLSTKLETEETSSPEKKQKGFGAMDMGLGLDEDAFEFREKKDTSKEEEETENQEDDESQKDQSTPKSDENTPEGEENAPTSLLEGSPPSENANGAELEGTAPEKTDFDEAQEASAHFREVTAATILLPAHEPFVHLLMSQNLVGQQEPHPYLRLGCELVTNPDNEFARRKNLRCAMAEASWSREELLREFGKELVEDELQAMKENGRLLTTQRREVNEVTGMVNSVDLVRYVGHPLPHRSASMGNVAPDHLTILDRHTKRQLLKIDRVRGLSDVYPGLVFLARGRRYRICNPEDQMGFDDGFIYSDPYERPVVTAKVRDLVFEPAHKERRQRKRRREDRWPGYEAIRSQRRATTTSKAPSSPALSSQQKPPLDSEDKSRRTDDRRAAMVHSIGGSEFMLWYPWVHLHEWVRGVKTYTHEGVLLDVTYYGAPIETRYRTRGAILAFHKGGKDASTEVLHSLVHLFRHVLPAFVRHNRFDLDIAYMKSFGPDKLPAIAFLDRHPGDAGFARSVSPEVFKHLCYWSYRLLTDCPAKCDSPWGCYYCLRSTSCNAAHGEGETHLDKESTLALLSELLGGFVH